MSGRTPGRYFDDLYRSDDPYGYRDRWYEARKRSLLLASLTRESFDRGWEIGCSNGESTAALAPRTRTLLATDLSARAVALARARVAGFGHVEVRQADHPATWPDGSFDLVVLSEVGYFMSQPDLETTCTRLAGSLAAGGLVVACHWLPAFDEAPLDGQRVHDTLDARLGLDRVFCYRDADFLLGGWSDDSRSVAMAEGLR